MEIKKFTAPTQSEALMKAKEEMGPALVIMNVKTIRPKGIKRLFVKPVVELTAALEEAQPMDNGQELLAEIKKIQKKHEVPEEPVYTRESVTKKADNIYDDMEEENKGHEGIEEKLDTLQELIEQQMKEKLEEGKEEKTEEEDAGRACIELIRRQLLSAEVREEYIDQLIDEIRGTLKKDVSVDNILAGIYQKIVLKLGQTSTIKLSKEHCRFVFFVGPTGVGKTTTIAKIASSFHLKKKAKTVLITSDTYRIAAVEQLKTYANIMGISLKVVYSPKEMEEVYEEYKDYDLVLIDTAGRSHKDRQQQEDIWQLVEAVPKEYREVYLVLSATTKYTDLVKITECYQKIGKCKFIFTKLDETDAIGNLFNLRMLTGNALSYVTWGQNVPEDIGVINPQKIAKQLLGGND